MKPLVIYHANCTDGFGAAFAAWLKLGDKAEYIPMGYGQEIVPTQIATERVVYVLDFSFPRHTMEGLFAVAQRVIWLDHHASVFKDWGVPLDGVVDELTLGLVQPNDHTVALDNNKSGAMLAWEYFHPGTEVPMLIRHIDDRDRWQFKMSGSRELHAAMDSLKPWTFSRWDLLFHVDGIRLEALKDEGSAILRAHSQHVQAALKQAKTCVVRWGCWKEMCGAIGFREAVGCSANAPAFLASDLGHELANKSGTFGLVWSMAGDGQIHCELRSNGDYDVSAIAKCFGGGGHRNAAGFSVEMSTLLGWLK